MELGHTNNHTVFMDNGVQSPVNFVLKFPNTLVRDGQQNPWEIALTRMSLIPLFKRFPSGTFSYNGNAWKRCFSSSCPKFNQEKLDNYIASNLVGKADFEYSEWFTGKDICEFITAVIKLAIKIIKVQTSVLNPESTILSLVSPQPGASQVKE